MKTIKTIKTKFDLLTFMTANRGLVIAKFNEAKEEGLNGTCRTMKEFGVNVFDFMRMNNARSEKKALSDLASALSWTYFEATKRLFVTDYKYLSEAKQDGFKSRLGCANH